MGIPKGLVQERTAHEDESKSCYLVAPLEIATIAHQAGLDIAQTTMSLSEPVQTSGILVCLPHTPVRALPPGWAGVWARKEAPPPGPWVPLPAEMAANAAALGRALCTAETWRRERLVSAGDVQDNAARLKALNEIGIALSAERDPARLLALILSRARHLVAADAGSLYLIEKDNRGNTALRFALAQNDSVEAPWKSSLLPLNRHSVAGAVAEGNKVVVVDDAYALPPDGPIHHDHRFDTRFGYRTRSMVGIPLTTREGEVLGVLQLINRKPRAAVPLADPRHAAEVIPFSTSDVEVLRSLTSQAAVSLENSRLHEDIERLFEGFVTASVAAIEQRDPSTSGHSARVAEGTVALALRVGRLTHGPWAGCQFSDKALRELRYAALLHDFGKVGVREKVLTKSEKLYKEQLEALQQRFVLAQTIHRADRFESWLAAALQDPADMKKRLPLLYEELRQELAALKTMQHTIEAANQPSILPEGDFSALQPMRDWEFRQPEGAAFSLLTDGELQALSIRRGSLTHEERIEIESHVTHTYHFLQMIPWTRDLARVPELAYGHHEKLDGSGYPRGLTAEAIPLGVRIMTIADIFDALTATDRPYKKALPIERALGILEAEAKENKLDASLVKLWIEARVWESLGAA